MKMNQEHLLDWDNKVHTCAALKQTFDLNEYCESNRRRGKFVGFAFLDIGGLNTNCANWYNDLIRKKSVDKEDHKKLKHSINARGWVNSEKLPGVNRNGEIIDGRSRIRAAKSLDMTHVPVAVYDDAELSVADDAARGTRSNTDALPRVTADFKDYVSQLTKLVILGELEHTEKAMKAQLVKGGFGAPSMYDLDTKYGKDQMNKCVKEANTDIELHFNIKGNVAGEYLIPMEKDQVIELINDRWLGYDVEGSVNDSAKRCNTVLMGMHYYQDMQKVIHSALPAAAEKGWKTPLKIILYASKDTKLDDTRMGYKTSILRMQEFTWRYWAQQFVHVQNVIDSVYDGLPKTMRDIQRPDVMGYKTVNVPFEFVGVVPQVRNRKSHEKPMNGGFLDTVVPLEKGYIYNPDAK